jgi:anthranilate/para-aminobenzoate synthase component I
VRILGLEPRARRQALPDDMARVIAALAEQPAAVALLGDGRAGRGRFSVFGVPAHIHPLTPKGLKRAFDEHPRDRLRVVFLGYELGRPAIALPERAAPRGQPAGLVLDLASAVVIDHHENVLYTLGDEAAAWLERPAVSSRTHAITLEALVDDRTHAQRIATVLEHIAAGDIYQASLTRRLAVRGDLDAPQAALKLCALNPVPHGAWMRAPGIELVSNSMETLLQLDPTTRRAESLPIKGTCARPENDPHDQARAAVLLADPKERAEHVMIVDLVRNDLGKVSVHGGVSVPRLFGAEPYKGVWHCVSTVQGELKPDASQGDLVTALFPGGSITGAPKRRAVELLTDIEVEPRGAYTGSLALIGADGSLSMSLLIRTLVHDNEGWSLNVGGGIVADSRAEREIAETWEKVSVFQRVLG